MVRRGEVYSNSFKGTPGILLMHRSFRSLWGPFLAAQAAHCRHQSCTSFLRLTQKNRFRTFSTFTTIVKLLPNLRLLVIWDPQLFPLCWTVVVFQNPFSLRRRWRLNSFTPSMTSKQAYKQQFDSNRSLLPISSIPLRSVVQDAFAVPWRVLWVSTHPPIHLHVPSCFLCHSWSPSSSNACILGDTCPSGFLKFSNHFKAVWSFRSKNFLSYNHR